MKQETAYYKIWEYYTRKKIEKSTKIKLATKKQENKVKYQTKTKFVSEQIIIILTK